MCYLKSIQYCSAGIMLSLFTEKFHFRQDFLHRLTQINWNIISISLYDADDDLCFFFHVLILLQQSMAGFNVQYYSLETHRSYCSPGCMPFTLKSKNNIQEILNFLIFKRKFHWKCISVSTSWFTENFQVCPNTDPHREYDKFNYKITSQ